VAAVLTEAVISSVNLSEVIARLADAGRSRTEISEFLEALELEVASFDTDRTYATVTGDRNPPSNKGMSQSAASKGSEGLAQK